MTSFIKVPFAQSGDKTNPPATDTGGGVNWTQGYPLAYSKDPETDPSAKRIEREDFNGILFELSSAVNEIQVSGVAPFITTADNGGTAFAYGIGAVVSYNNNVWFSRVDSNTTIPAEGANWSRVVTQGDNLYGYKFRGATSMENSGTYNVPSGVRLVRVIITGGGGGASGSSGAGTSYPAGGGGGGGATLFCNIGVGLGDTLTITIGAGGTGSPGQVVGGQGGITKVGYKTVSYEAGGGNGGGVTGQGGQGQAATSGNGYVGISGGDGSDGNTGSSFVPGNGGSSYWGGGGRAAGGSNGFPGKAYGSGGGASYGGTAGTGYNGANGRGGVVVIEEYY